MIKTIQKALYNLIKKYRVRHVKRFLDSRSKTLLDIGCEDLFFYDLIKDEYNVTLVDVEPKNWLIKKGDVQNLSFKDKSFDIVSCQQVLEHLHNPLKAISELKRVTKKQLIITVPYEPFFTLLRFLFWEKEHLWAITPQLLRIYLGKPEYEQKFFFKRYYLGIWRIK